MSAIDMKYVSVAKEIAMDPAFIEQSRNLVNSGLPVKLAIARGNFDLAR